MQEICGKEETFPEVIQGKTTAGIILQVCALPRLFRCQNDILPLLTAEQKETIFKTKKSVYSIFFPLVLDLERCGSETLKLRENKTREVRAKWLTFLLLQSHRLMDYGQAPHNKVGSIGHDREGFEWTVTWVLQSKRWVIFPSAHDLLTQF